MISSHPNPKIVHKSMQDAMPPHQLWLLCDQDTWFGWCFWSLHKWWVFFGWMLWCLQGWWAFLDVWFGASMDDGPLWMNALMPQWMTGLLDDFLGASMDDKPFWTNDLMPPWAFWMNALVLYRWWTCRWILIFPLTIRNNMSCFYSSTLTQGLAGERVYPIHVCASL